MFSAQMLGVADTAEMDGSRWLSKRRWAISQREFSSTAGVSGVCVPAAAPILEYESRRLVSLPGGMAPVPAEGGKLSKRRESVAWRLSDGMTPEISASCVAKS